jgi:hypothetical protein
MIIRMDVCRVSERTVERDKKWESDPEVTEAVFNLLHMYI